MVHSKRFGKYIQHLGGNTIFIRENRLSGKSFFDDKKWICPPFIWQDICLEYVSAGSQPKVFSP